VRKNELLAQRLRELSLNLQTSQGYTPEQVLAAISNKDSVPASVFSGTLSPLQALVTYLKDHKKNSFATISKELGRTYRAVWGAYSDKGIKFEETSFYIPLELFENSSHSILETVVLHLKESYEMKFSEIARLLNKNDRTVWTVWNRAKKKNAQNS
jgi:hypothetical protein